MSSDRNQDDFASLFEASAPSGARTERARSLALGEAVRAEVVQVGRTGVFVEVLGRGDSGKRPEAFLEAIDLQDSSGVLTAKVGDVIEAIVVAIERTGAVRLGRSMGAPAGLDELARAHAGRVPVDGKVAAANKGGLEVEIAGLRAFCPNSQIERAFVADPQSYVGRSLQFLVTELRDNGRRIVLSRRALLEQEQARRAHTLATLQVGAVVRGSVTAVRDFGAFVDLGGVEGLIPTSELSHERGRKAADVLSPGDVVEVQVRALTAQPAETRSAKSPAAQRSEPALKITLSLKALAADPWTTVREQIPEGKVLRGTVTRVVDFGAFVQLAPGIEGLLHVSELSGKPAHPSTVCSVGQQLNVVVRKLDADAKKIGLAPAPDGLAIGSDARGPALVVSAIVSGTVDRIEPFGLFLQLEGTRGRSGRGLIPNVELGVPRGADLRKLFPLGTRLTAKVLETGEGKLRLSVRAVKDDEERAEFDGYRATQAAEKLGTFADLFKKK